MAGIFALSTTWAHDHDNVEILSSSTVWHQGYTLILMNNTDIASANQARDYVISQGGRIAILSPPHVMLGWISPELSTNLIGKYGIEYITQSPIDLNKLKYQDDQTLALASFLTQYLLDCWFRKWLLP